MHEMGYCEGVLEAVERRASGRQVVGVGVRIGAVHRVVADAFQQSFSMAAAGGVAADAATEVVVVPVHGHCMDCRHEFDSDDPAPACPACGSLDVAVVGGDEVILEWLEYAEEEAEEAERADRTSELVPAHTHDSHDHSHDHPHDHPHDPAGGD